MKIFEFDKDKSYLIAVDNIDSVEDIREIHNAFKKAGITTIVTNTKWLNPEVKVLEEPTQKVV